VQGRHERLRVLEAARHPDRLGADGQPPFDLVRGVHLHRQPRQHPRPQRAVLLWERGERLFEEPDPRRPRLEAGEQQEAPQPDHVAERGAREHRAVAQAPGELGRLLEARSRCARVAGSPAGIAEAQEQLAALLARALLGGSEQAKRLLVVSARLLVGEHACGALPGANEVADRRRGVAEGSRQSQVMAISERWESRSFRYSFSSTAPCDAGRGASPLRGRRRASRGPAHGRTRSAAEGGVLHDHAGARGLGQDVEQATDAELAGLLEHAPASPLSRKRCPRPPVPVKRAAELLELGHPADERAAERPCRGGQSGRAAVAHRAAQSRPSPTACPCPRATPPGPGRRIPLGARLGLVPGRRRRIRNVRQDLRLFRQVGGLRRGGIRR
jgi:hypothetical protein